MRACIGRMHELIERMIEWLDGWINELHACMHSFDTHPPMVLIVNHSSQSYILCVTVVQCARNEQNHIINHVAVPAHAHTDT